MKPFCFAAALVVLTAGCAASTGSPANSQSAQPSSADTDTNISNVTDGARPGAPTSKPLSVGVSYPDTQLILPWFLNDIIDFINYR